MENIIATLQSVNWRLVFVGIAMAAVGIGTIYVLLETAKTIQARLSASRVELPDLDNQDTAKKESSKFTTPDEFEVEFVDEDSLPEEEFKQELPADSDFFIEAMTLETGVFIPKKEAKVDLPEVPEVVDKNVIEELSAEIIEDEAHSELEALEEVMFNVDEAEELHYEVVGKHEVTQNEEQDNGMFDDLLEDILEEDNHA